jgi:hypothetical protein
MSNIIAILSSRNNKATTLEAKAKATTSARGTSTEASP